MVALTTAAIGVLIAADVGYFIKTAVYAISGRFLPKLHPLQKSKLYGICTTRDVDFLLNHVNNARYVRQMDFGRLNHLFRCNMLKLSHPATNKVQFLLAATTIRYRKSIYLFMPYRLETQVVHWDDKNLYYRQNFISLHDNFVRAAAYTKLATVGAVPKDMLQQDMSDELTPLEPPEDLLKWIEGIKLNSESLRKVSS